MFLPTGTNASMDHGVFRTRYTLSGQFLTVHRFVSLFHKYKIYQCPRDYLIPIPYAQSGLSISRFYCSHIILFYYPQTCHLCSKQMSIPNSGAASPAQARALIWARLPNLVHNPAHSTQHVSVSQLQLSGDQRTIWQKFESDVRLFTSQHLGQPNSGVLPPTPDERVVVANEGGVGARLMHNVGHHLDPVLRALSINIRFGDFESGSVPQTYHNARKPDFVLINNNHRIIAGAEIKTFWTLSGRQGGQDPSPLGNLMGMCSKYAIAEAFLTINRTNGSIHGRSPSHVRCFYNVQSHLLHPAYGSLHFEHSPPIRHDIISSGHLLVSQLGRHSSISPKFAVLHMASVLLQT